MQRCSAFGFNRRTGKGKTISNGNSGVFFRSFIEPHGELLSDGSYTDLNVYLLDQQIGSNKK